ncbi:hypothetical protein [Marinobacter salarius]|uniref:hypothetical protein n=1 Tax=Marinobacter salarius TaxID=1420917 RepID=UPI000F871AAA|nr:hypothetical protein [Marinobacter salarius]
MKAVAAVLIEHSARADAQYIAPESWKANVSQAGENNLSAVERIERLLAAIPTEIKERKVNAKLAAFQEPKNAKRRLERVLQKEPKRGQRSWPGCAGNYRDIKPRPAVCLRPAANGGQHFSSPNNGVGHQWH